MTFAEKMTAIADKIRILVGSSQGMDLDLMASSLEAEKNNVANAFTEIASMGGTLPNSQISANLASAISTISTGTEIVKQSGSFTTDMSGSASVSLSFQPDLVAIDGGSYAGVRTYNAAMFAMANSNTLEMVINPNDTASIFTGLTIMRSGSGFSVSALKFAADLTRTADAGRTLTYIAWKYT